MRSTGESYRVPNLSESPLGDCLQPPSHFKLSYRVHTHYNTILSVTGEVCKDLELLYLSSEEINVLDVLLSFVSAYVSLVYYNNNVAKCISACPSRTKSLVNTTHNNRDCDMVLGNITLLIIPCLNSPP